jgi:hypothetical protein
MKDWKNSTSGKKKKTNTRKDNEKETKNLRRNGVKRLELHLLIGLTFIKHFAIYYSDR